MTFDDTEITAISFVRQNASRLNVPLGWYEYELADLLYEFLCVKTKQMESDLEKLQERNNFLETQQNTPIHIQIKVMEETLQIYERSLNDKTKRLKKAEELLNEWKTTTITNSDFYNRVHDFLTKI